MVKSGRALVDPTNILGLTRSKKVKQLNEKNIPLKMRNRNEKFLTVK